MLGLLVLFIESYANCALLGSKDGFDIMLSLLIICPFLLMLVLNLEITSKAKIKAKTIAMLSTGIYVIHPFLLAISNEFLSIPSSLDTIFVSALSILASLILIKINKKIKYIL